MITFQQEMLFEVVDEVQPLLQAHYDELCNVQEVAKLNPRWDVYAELEHSDAFFIYTARESGKLVGYSAYFVNFNLHYADLKVGLNDLFWLNHEHRKGMTPVRFLKFCESKLKAIGVVKLVYHAKQKNNFAPLLRRLGYADDEVTVGRLL